MMEQLRNEDGNLLRVICDIGEIKTMKASVRSCVESGIIVGLATTIGGLLLGPRGIALGGLAAGAMSMMAGRKFKSVPEIIKNDTTLEQKSKLVRAINNLLTQENILSLADFALRATTQNNITTLIISLVVSFLQNELNYSVIN